MDRHCSFRVGGPADLFLRVETEAELGRVIRLLEEAGEPFFILGKGTNLLVGDGGYRGAVVTMTGAMEQPVTDTGKEAAVPDESTASLHSAAVSGDEILAGGGASLASVAGLARAHGLAGLEFAGGIPGSVGGALVMNAGAYGGEMKNVTARARLLMPDGSSLWLSKEELQFGYRHSVLKDNHGVVLQAVLRLTPGDPGEISARMAELAGKRRDKQPLEYPSAGSTFKRPAGHYAGQLIEEAGLRGYTVGGACVSEKHCGFVINKDHATAADVLQVIRDVQQRVYEHSGVRLEREVICLGEF